MVVTTRQHVVFVLLCRYVAGQVQAMGGRDAQDVEVTYPSPSDEVFRVTLRQQVEKPGGYRFMAARRIPSLY